MPSTKTGQANKHYYHRGTAPRIHGDAENKTEDTDPAHAGRWISASPRWVTVVTSDLGLVEPRARGISYSWTPPCKTVCLMIIDWGSRKPFA